MAPRIVSAILFSPRGGSAHVARALANGLRTLGWHVELVAGSRGDLGTHGDASAFYGEVHPVRFDAALASDDPPRFDGPPGTAPMHPSFEDRPGAPDWVFASLDDLAYERQVHAWARELRRAGAGEADVIHLHHLTPINEAVARIAADVPVVGQLHGTELLMLEQIVAGPPAGWRHAERWAERLQRWAANCERIVVAPGGVDRAISLLELPRERVVPLPNGVDLELFHPRQIDRRSFWRRVLLDAPQGESYREEAVEQLAAGVVFMYVGRFTAVKRLELLIAAFHRARAKFPSPGGLVLVGGHPGETEGEHPAEIVRRLGVSDVFLAGWHSQQRLPEFFSAADAVVLASEREQFGSVLVEGMACGLPVIATRSIGPATIVDDGETGWLVSPHDEAALADALVEVVADPAERERRGSLALDAARQRFSWTGVAAQFAEVLEQVLGSTRVA